MSGKGDNPRPLFVTPEQFAERFDAIDWNAREREQRAKRVRENEADVRELKASANWPKTEPNFTAETGVIAGVRVNCGESK